MSSARGLANHSLYMARLVLAGWSRELGQAGASRQAMQAAFAPAARLHLLDAYGWLLLATIRQNKLPDHAPHHSQELPPLGPGIAEPGELDEYRLLEREGWIGRLQATLPRGLPPKTRPGLLAISANYPQIEDYEEWAASFSALFARMADSLDEN